MQTFNWTNGKPLQLRKLRKWQVVSNFHSNGYSGALKYVWIHLAGADGILEADGLVLQRRNVSGFYYKSYFFLAEGWHNKDVTITESAL